MYWFGVFIYLFVWEGGFISSEMGGGFKGSGMGIAWKKMELGTFADFSIFRLQR